VALGPSPSRWWWADSRDHIAVVLRCHDAQRIARFLHAKVLQKGSRPVIVPTVPTLWPRDHPRTRLVVLHLWDGRCGHCDTPLLTSDALEYEPDGFQEAPFEVDHVDPVSKGGPDTIANYIAACDHCNRNRSNAPITGSVTHRKIAFVRGFIASEEFLCFVDKSCEIERAIRDHAYFSMVRCFEHRWHIYGSPWQSRCFDRCQEHFPGNLGVEWWSRFGLLSNYVRLIVGESLHIRGQVRGYDWWLQPEGWQLMLPRYCSSPYDISNALANVEAFGDRPSSAPAPECFFGAAHRLSRRNQGRALIHSARSSVDRLAQLACFADNGVTSKSLLRLWDDKRWPTHLLFDYRTAVQTIQASGNRRKSLAELRKLRTRREAETYLQEVNSLLD
jgi:hypothetical protein